MIKYKWQTYAMNKIKLGQKFSDKEHNIKAEWIDLDLKGVRIMIYQVQSYDGNTDYLVFDTNREQLISFEGNSREEVKEAAKTVKTIFNRGLKEYQTSNLAEEISKELGAVSPKIFDTKALDDSGESARSVSMRTIKKAKKEIADAQQEERREGISDIMDLLEGDDEE